jgi:hypothetical protein
MYLSWHIVGPLLRWGRSRSPPPDTSFFFGLLVYLLRMDYYCMARAMQYVLSVRGAGFACGEVLTKSLESDFITTHREAPRIVQTPLNLTPAYILPRY